MPDLRDRNPDVLGCIDARGGCVLLDAWLREVHAMTLPAWRERELREQEAERRDRAEARAHNLFDFADEFDVIDGVLVTKKVTSALYNAGAIYCRDCLEHAGSAPLPIVDHADKPCAQCHRPLGAARPLLQRASRRQR